MKFVKMEKVKDGKYLKNYELTYINKAGRDKTYEIVSRNELKDASELGQKVSGVSIIATMNGKLLLLHEFRMGVNKRIYNLCAGMMEEGESIEECIHRELFEETGLKVKEIKKILPPSYSAVAISDIKTYIAFVEVCFDENACMDQENSMENSLDKCFEKSFEKTFSSQVKYVGSENEDIENAFYTPAQVSEMLETEDFSSRAQFAAYHFVVTSNI